MRKVLLSMVALALATPAFAGEFNKVLSAGDKAPDFAGIPAVAPNGEAASLTLSDIKEDVVVLVFLANHCPVVVACEDRLNEFTSEYKDKGVRVVGVAVDHRDSDKLPAIKKRLADKNDGKINYVYGHDESKAIGKAYGATVTPTVFVLDKDRNIAYLGAIDDNHNQEDKVTKHYLKDAVDAVLAGKAPAVKETRATGCGISYNN